MGRGTWRLLAAGALGACGGALPAPQAERQSSLDRVPPAILEAYGRRRTALGPALVSLRSIGGRKSGAIIDPAGLVLTCLHGSSLEVTEAVTFADGTIGTARVRAIAPDLDIAVLEILRPPGPFPALAFARSADAGEWTFLARPGSSGEDDAAGRPAVVGVPLAYGPDLYVHSGILAGLPAFPGDSGAPLLNVRGEIVGVALGAARRSGTGTLAGASAAGILDALPYLRRGTSLAPLSGAQQVETFLRALGRPVPALEASGNPDFVRDYRALLADLDRSFREEWQGRSKLTAEGAQAALERHYREVSRLLDRYGLLR